MNQAVWVGTVLSVGQPPGARYDDDVPKDGKPKEALMTAPDGPVVLAESTFNQRDYADEIRAGASDFRVATTVWLENDRVRIWDFLLPPRYRHPFHCHRTSYYWVCTAAGRAIQRFPDGTMATWQFTVGDVDFLEASPAQPMVHDLENVGDTPLRFVTVEVLS